MPTHEYVSNVVWNGGRDGQGRVEMPASGESLELRVGREFGGPGDATNPEELLTSAVASCYSITFGIVAANRKLPITDFKLRATGEVDQQGAAMTFKRIKLQPSIVVSASATEEQINAVRDVAMKADHYCMISNTIRDKVELTVEPAISVG